MPGPARRVQTRCCSNKPHESPSCYRRLALHTHLGPGSSARRGHAREALPSSVQICFVLLETQTRRGNRFHEHRDGWAKPPLLQQRGWGLEARRAPLLSLNGGVEILTRFLREGCSFVGPSCKAPKATFKSVGEGSLQRGSGSTPRTNRHQLTTFCSNPLPSAKRFHSILPPLQQQTPF